VLTKTPFATRRKHWPQVFVHPFNRQFQATPGADRVFEHPFFDKGLSGMGRGRVFGRRQRVAGLGSLGSWFSSFVNHNHVVTSVAAQALNFVPYVGTVAAVAASAALKQEYNKKAKQDYNKQVDAWNAANIAGPVNANAAATSRTGSFTAVVPNQAIVKASADDATFNKPGMTKAAPVARRSRFSLHGLGATPASGPRDPRVTPFYVAYLAEFKRRNMPGSPLSFQAFADLFLAQWTNIRNGKVMRKGVFAMKGLGEADESAFFTDPSSSSTFDFTSFLNNALKVVNTGINTYGQVKSAVAAAQKPPAPPTSGAPAAAPATQPKSAAPAGSGSSMLPLLVLGALALVALKH